jgi:hypothetical protein
MADAWFGLRLVSECGDWGGHTAAAAVMTTMRPLAEKRLLGFSGIEVSMIVAQCCRARRQTRG